jgi:hypothetical protein
MGARTYVVGVTSAQLNLGEKGKDLPINALKAYRGVEV